MFPGELYRSVPISRFIERCKIQKVEWAIFSDKYGVWFPFQKNKWYDKHPDTVTEEEFEELLKDFDNSLEKFGEIWFYHHPKWLHPFYRKLLNSSILKEKINLFSRLAEIE